MDELGGNGTEKARSKRTKKISVKETTTTMNIRHAGHYEKSKPRTDRMRSEGNRGKKLPRNTRCGWEKYP